MWCFYAVRVRSKFSVSAIVVCSNIVLNAIFIYGYFGFPRMEIAGAALATVIANGIGLVITIYILHFTNLTDTATGYLNITENTSG